MTDIQDPWEMAETAIYQRLLSITGATDKRNAFLGYQPLIGNSWAFKIGGSGEEANTNLQVPMELWMFADISGLFLERKEAQRFAMKVVRSCPIKRVSNVQTFRIRRGGHPDIKADEIRLMNDRGERLVWVVEIGFEVVFNLVDRVNAEPTA